VAFNHYLLLILNCSNEVWGQPAARQAFQFGAYGDVLSGVARGGHC
jgi:hypothetical protein